MFKIGKQCYSIATCHGSPGNVGSLDPSQSILLFWASLKTTCFWGYLVNGPEQHTQMMTMLSPKFIAA